MKISVNRLAKLAGIETGSRRNLNEGSNRSFHEEPYYQDEVDFRYGRGQLAEEADKDEAMEMDPAMMGEEDMSMMPGMMETDDIDDKDEIADPNIEELMKGDPDEIIDVDETMLVQELRRAKRIMNENRTRRQVQLAERSRINSIIDEEVENMMHKYNLGSSWVYGDNRPTASKPGRITRSFPGIGFGKKF